MESVTDEFSLAKKKLAKDIIGEIVLSEQPGKVLKKWRIIFKISQKTLAKVLGITSSVISDYESGRRQSPGIKMIKKYVNTLLNIDVKRGGKVIKSFCEQNIEPNLSKAILDIREFPCGVSVEEFCNVISSFLIVKPDVIRDIYGYTVIDSVKAVTELPFSDLVKLYGITTQRALIFTNISRGRAPLVAIKITNLHPGLVVLHGIDIVDEIAKRIAETENIPLALCKLESVEDVLNSLKRV
ncbi:MAG: transcriptional regulator [Candidatus Aenigmatarchaeota archaeon]|nr:MAG: transcriptional regulator [Candidatus Aenigmarchaeota archaeon]